MNSEVVQQAPEDVPARDIKTAKDCGATTYTNRHGLEDPYIAMSCKQFAVYTSRIRGEAIARTKDSIQERTTGVPTDEHLQKWLDKEKTK